MRPLGSDTAPLGRRSLEGGPGPYFLGPAGENAELVERILIEAFRDHVFWRRNFHPEDGPFIQEATKRSEAFDAAASTMRQELYRLLSRLKQGAPFFSPRYIGHMLSDTTIASQLGYFAAMLYNPNNISEEGGSVTMALELEVGEQLARLVGYGPAAWGHLASGGSVANLEALWAARALKYFPAAAAVVARTLALAPVPVGTGMLQDLDAWQLMNVPTADILALRDTLSRRARSDDRLARALDAATLGALGFLAFHRRFEAVMEEALPEPVVLVPSTKHYSWVKVMNLLGLGQASLVELPLDAEHRLDPARCDATLSRLAAERTPVLALVAVLGSTETGSVDALDRLMDAKDAASARGLSLYCHVDAAYGGYAAAMYREPGGGWTADDSALARSFKALPRTDSVTIDPHKLGYAPYPAGAVVFGDRRVSEFLTAQAPYVFFEGQGARMPIGQYVVEGSKPGAAAAAVWLNHRVLPLDTTGYGALIGSTIASARSLRDALAGFRSSAGFRLIPLNDPDLNVVVFLAVPPGVRTLEALNRFNEALYRRVATDSERVVFTYEFVVSKTALAPATYGRGLEARLDPAIWAMVRGGASLSVLRSTLMNPFIAEAIARGTYLPELLSTLDREMQALVVEPELPVEWCPEAG